MSKLVRPMAPGPRPPVNTDAPAAPALDIATNASPERCAATATPHKFAATHQQATIGTMCRPAPSAVSVQDTATLVRRVQNAATIVTHKFATQEATETPSGAPSGPAPLATDVTSNPTKQSATVSTRPSDERTTRKATLFATRTADKATSKLAVLSESGPRPPANTVAPVVSTKGTATSASSTTAHAAAAPKKCAPQAAREPNTSTLLVAWAALTVTATAAYPEPACAQAEPNAFARQHPQVTSTQTRSVRTVATAATATSVLPTQNVAAETQRRNVWRPATDTNGTPEHPVNTAVLAMEFVTNAPLEADAAQEPLPKSVPRPQQDTSGKVESVATDVTTATATPVLQTAKSVTTTLRVFVRRPAPVTSTTTPAVPTVATKEVATDVFPTLRFVPPNQSFEFVNRQATDTNGPTKPVAVESIAPVEFVTAVFV